MTNILLVEDSRISRETIESRIARSPDYLLIASIENAANAAPEISAASTTAAASIGSTRGRAAS